LPLLLAGAVLVTGLISSGPFLIRVLYDSRYQEAGWILQFLAVMGWFQILEATNSAAVMAQGRVSWVAGGNLAKLAGMATLIPLGFHLGGVRGALAGLVLAEFLRFLVSTVAAARRGLHSLWTDAGVTALIGCVSWIAHLVGSWAAVGRHASLLGFLAAGTAAAVPWSLVGLGVIRFRGRRTA
jgi:O-antigen/teichoic acid export membrane protein